MRQTLILFMSTVQYNELKKVQIDTAKMITGAFEIRTKTEWEK